MTDEERELNEEAARLRAAICTIVAARDDEDFDALIAAFAEAEAEAVISAVRVSGAKAMTLVERIEQAEGPSGMGDEELINFARVFREGILQGRGSHLMCAAVSWPLAGLLNACGVECEAVECDLGDCNHIWIKLADGRALDATADQFNYPFFKQYPPVYLGPPTELHVGQEP